MAVQITKNNVGQIFKSMSELTGKGVYVGIPESGDPRKQGSKINNAALGYIHEFGDPKTNIPARPFLIPGVKNVEKQTLAQFKKATEAALSGDSKLSDQLLNLAGNIAVNEVKRVIQSNIPPPLKPDTVRKRHKSRGDKTRRANENLYMSLVATGIAPGVAQDQAGIISLIDTGALRDSITFVVKKK